MGEGSSRNSWGIKDKSSTEVSVEYHLGGLGMQIDCSNPDHPAVPVPA